MALRQTRLYYNTGFNVGNTPGNISILNQANYIDLEAHWDNQDFFLQSIKLKATYDQVKNADYLKYGEAYYWIVGIQMPNTNTAEIFLQLDALASMGGAKTLTYTSGMLRRAHPLNDTAFSNLIDEPIGRQRPLVQRSRVTLGPNSCESDTIILSTLQLGTEVKIDSHGNVVPAHGTATIYKGDLDDPDAQEQSVITPNYPNGARGCTVGQTRINGVDYYLLNDDVTAQHTSNQISYLRSLGAEQAIVGAYALPKYYSKNKITTFTNILSHTRNIQEIKNAKVETKRVGGWDSVGIKWNKTKIINNKFVAVSMLSGELKTYDLKDIRDGNNVMFCLSADLNINGKPYIWPAKFDGGDMSGVFNANGVSGLEWLNIPLTINGASGSLWIKNDYVRSVGEIGVDTAQMGYGTVKSLLGNLGRPSVGEMVQARFGQEDLSQAFKGYGGPNLGGLVDTVANTAFNSAKLIYRADKLDVDFAKANIVAPTITGAPVQGLQTTIPNNFIVYNYTPSDDDRRKFDAFFDKYGYAQDCVFDKAYLTDHWNLGYVYIQTSDIHIGRTGKANDVGIAVKNLAESQLDGGIRIWDRLPS